MGLYEDFTGSQSPVAQMRVSIKILYDADMTISDRIRAYENLASIDPTNFPVMSRVALVHSITKGKLAQSVQGVTDIKREQGRAQLQAGRSQALEDILYDPSENLAARTQAYDELSKSSPDRYPEKDLVSIKKNIAAGDIQTTARALHPDYISPQEQKKIDEQKAKEEKVLAKEQEKKLADQLNEIKGQLSTLKKVREQIDVSGVGLQTGLLNLAEKRIDLETKSSSLDKNSPDYRSNSEYLTKHLDILTQREELFTRRKEMANQRVKEIGAAQSYAEARQRYLKGEPEPDIQDDYTIYTWNKDGTLSSIKNEKRPSVDQRDARDAGEFAYVPPRQFSEQNIFDADTGALTTLPTAEGQGFTGFSGHEKLFGTEEE